MEHRTRPHCPRSTHLPRTHDQAALQLQAVSWFRLLCHRPVPVSLHAPKRSSPWTSAAPNSPCREPKASRTSLGRTEPADLRIETSTARATKPLRDGVESENEVKLRMSPNWSQ